MEPNTMRVTPKKCLVVDDSKIARLVARKILEDLDFEIVEASSGDQALSICDSEMPDAVLLDWRMPEMNGLQFLRQMRGKPGGADPVVVFCTSEDDSHHLRQARSAGADRCVMKPFDGSTIKSKFYETGLI